VALFIRFFVVAFGFFLSCLAAGAVLVIATLPAGTLEPPLEQFDWLILSGAVLTSAAFVSVIAFVPFMVVILIAETFALRSLFFYAIAGGVGGLLYGMTFPAASVATASFDRTMQITLAAGVAAGLIYWLAAGRSAGRWRGNSVQSAENI
jgi:hypothetical protein